MAVVGLHVSLNVFTPQHDDNWLQAEIIQGICVFSVPVFFMISGMNLFNYRQRYNLSTFFKHRVLKVGYALLIGSIICYLLYSIFPNSFYGTDAFNSLTVYDFTKRFLTNGINDIYWFFYIIIGIYMLVPILTHSANDTTTIKYILIVSFYVAIIIPMLEWFGVPAQAFSSLFNWPTFSMALFYFTAGWWIFHWSIEEKISRVVLAIAFIASTSLMILLGLYINGWWNANGMSSTYDRTLIIFSSPLCVIQSLSLFALCRKFEAYLQVCSNMLKQIIRKLSSLSLGIYLFQIPVINWFGMHNTPVILEFQPIKLAFIYIITAALVWIAKSLIHYIKIFTISIISS